ncbi:hypothetical protein BJF84_13435 [Rhodococcus sp. CUA-806]|nr:hypothetical protein BJF84_13435 [Rhodococcus sp. CUA-806]
MSEDSERIVFADQLKPGDVIVDIIDVTASGHFVELPIAQLSVGQLHRVGRNADRIIDVTASGHFVELPIAQLSVGQLHRVGRNADRIAVVDIEHTRTEFFRTDRRLRIHRETD